MSRTVKKSKPYNAIKQLKRISAATIGVIPPGQVVPNCKQKTKPKHKLSVSDQLDPERES